MSAAGGIDRILQRNGLQRLREVPEVALNAWYEVVDFEVLEFQSVNIREGGKVAQAELGGGGPTDTELLFHPDCSRYGPG